MCASMWWCESTRDEEREREYERGRLPLGSWCHPGPLGQTGSMTSECSECICSLYLCLCASHSSCQVSKLIGACIDGLIYHRTPWE